MMPIGLIADLVLIALLLVTFFHVVRLYRRLGDLRRDRDDFQKLIGEFATATAEASRALGDLRRDSDTAGRDLAGRIERAQAVTAELQHSTDDLRMLVSRADTAADRLEGLVSASRTAGAAPAPARHEPPVSDSRIRPGEDAQTQALLSALGRIR